MIVLCAIPGCGSDADVGAFKPGSGSSDGKICLLNNCTEDEDCDDCPSSATVCFVEEKRCIACGPDAGGKKCKSGQTCTKYGACVPDGLVCEEDENGTPTGSCDSDADCLACGPKFRVCDGGKCIGCNAKNVTNCQSTDICREGACVARCPKECIADNDCGDCGVPGKEAHACNKHVCAQCSPTMPCPDGGKCDFEHGTCVAPCGLGKAGKSNCTEDGNCAGCTGTTTCKLPAVGGGEGVCAAPATGCEDLGKGIFVLPDPFSRFTNLCSDNTDCANVSADINVGSLLRDLTGLDAIKDGNISYSMRACAAVEVRDRSCGVCVPCKVDTDCTDIDITKLAGDLFGKVGSVASKLLLDKAFGPNDRKIHTYCQNVAGDYGACLPCPSPLTRCAQTAEGVPETGACNHDVCATGGPLGIQCDTCTASVCAKDPYCCIREWDEQCKADVDLLCKDKTCLPDSCAFREAGWYCRSDPKLGGYRCDGVPGNVQIAEGRQCIDDRECKTEGEGPKAFAQLCTTESAGDEECPTGSLGKPRCQR